MDIKGVIRLYGMTQDSVAKNMGISKGALSQMVNGTPSVNSLRSIAAAIGCQVSDFFRDETINPEPEIRALVTKGERTWHAETVRELESIVEEIKKM